MQNRKTKSYFSKEFYTAFKSEPWLQAEKLPSYLGFYVKKEVIEELRNNSNHIICGRRGTGKTHFLGAFTETVNNDFNSHEIAIFISCIDFCSTPQVLLTEDVSFSIQKYTRLLFRTFLMRFTYQLAREVDDYIRDKLIYENTTKELTAISRCCDEILLNMMNMVEYGSPVGFKGTLTEKKRIDEIKGRNGKIDIGVNVSRNGFDPHGTIFAGGNKESKKETTVINEIISILDIDIIKYKNELNELIQVLEIDVLYVLIDEWMELDKNISLNIQPYFAQLLKTTFFNNKNISVKIASVWHNTNLYDRNILEKSKGIELGDDIILGLDLDVYFLKDENEILEFVKKMLFTRMCKLIPEMNDLLHNDIISDQFITELFDNFENFRVFVIASHGIPRDCLHIFHSCILRINRDFNNYAITRDVIRDVAQDIYLSEKRRSIDKNSSAQLLLNSINNYLDYSSNNFFLISATEAHESITVRKLVDEQIIHPLASESTPRCIRDTYRVFIIDYGNYIDWYKEKRKKIDINITENILPQFPANFEDCYSDYIIDISNIGDDILICQNCSHSFRKTASVYVKLHCCPICAEPINLTTAST